MKKLMCLIAVLILMSCTAAFADQLKLISAGNLYDHGEHISPYIMGLQTGGDPQFYPISLWCMDISHIAGGTPWAITIQDKSGDQQFREAAWLISQLGTETHPMVQWALWDLFDDTAVASHLASDPAFLSEVRALVALSENPANWSSVHNTITFYERASTTGDYGQNFMRVPEPASIVLLGFGLLSVASASLIRRGTRK